MAGPTKVSIIVPTYNRAHYIEETIRSVLSQTLSNWQLIIIDDGSIDHTEQVVNSFTDSRILYKRLDHSGLIAKVRNEGFSLASADYIAFLDSDDLWTPNKLSTQLDVLMNDPDIYFCISNGDQFGPGSITPPDWEQFYVGDLFNPIIKEEKFVFYVPSLLFKKEVLSHVTCLDPTYKVCSDIDFFLRIARSFKGAFQNERLVKIRKHEQTSSSTTDVLAYEEYLNMLDAFEKKDLIDRSLHTKLKARHLYKMGMLLRKKGDHSKSHNAFRQYCSLRPLHWKGWVRLLQTIRS
jgi:glycosyltransferase involved in cell wall biosynthesis